MSTGRPGLSTRVRRSQTPRRFARGAAGARAAGEAGGGSGRHSADDQSLEAQRYHPMTTSSDRIVETAFAGTGRLQAEPKLAAGWRPRHLQRSFRLPTFAAALPGFRRAPVNSTLVHYTSVSITQTLGQHRSQTTPCLPRARFHPRRPGTHPGLLRAPPRLGCAGVDAVRALCGGSHLGVPILHKKGLF